MCIDICGKNCDSKWDISNDPCRGVFDGQGATAWKQNECAKKFDCKQLGMNFGFNFINNSIVRDITSKDSKHFHVNVLGCNNFTFDGFKVLIQNVNCGPGHGISIGSLGKYKEEELVEDITMDNVQNLVIIDQEYCPNNQCSKGSGVPCEGVEIGDVTLTYNGAPVITTCTNVKPTITGKAPAAVKPLRYKRK
ncbi:hypothetical protein ACSQ67_014143 [Phaseolus vulgaris]